MSSGRGRRFDFDADDIAAAPAAQFALDKLEVRAAPFIVELHFRVAGQPTTRPREWIVRETGARDASG